MEGQEDTNQITFHKKLLFDELKKIHFAESIDWNIVSAILLRYKEDCAKLTSNEGQYPLQYMCKKQAPEEIIIQIIELYPEAAMHMDDDGGYPLHYACSNNQSEAVALELIRVFPDAAKNKDINGWYPLHFACSCRQSETVVQELIRVFPEAATHADKLYGNYPLHFACQNKPSVSVVQELINAFPEGIKHQNRFDYLPLHLACAWNAKLSVIKLLVFLYPAALGIVENNKKKPLDLARQPFGNSRTPIYENVEWFNKGIKAYKLECKARFLFLKKHWITAALDTHQAKTSVCIDLEFESK